MNGFTISKLLDRFLEIKLIASAFRGIKLAVGILVLDAGWRLLRRMKKDALSVMILAVSLTIMLGVNLFALRFSSIVLMLTAAGVSLLAMKLGWKGGGKE